MAAIIERVPWLAKRVSIAFHRELEDVGAAPAIECQPLDPDTMKLRDLERDSFRVEVRPDTSASILLRPHTVRHPIAVFGLLQCFGW
jgi:hypothetical protein